MSSLIDLMLQEGSSLLGTILKTSSLRNVDMTSFLNEIKCDISIAHQLQVLNAGICNDQQKDVLTLLYSILFYANEKFKFYMKEKQLCDVGMKVWDIK